MQCISCRKENAVLTTWEKIRDFFFKMFPKDIIDLTEEKFTKGFGEGYKKAYERLYAEGKIDQALMAIDDKLTRALRPIISIQKMEAINPQDVIDTVMAGGKPVLVMGGKELTPLERETLLTEADYFTRSNLWRIMQETVKQKAIEKTVMQSKTWEEALCGKMMVHNLGVQQSIINQILKK